MRQILKIDTSAFAFPITVACGFRPFRAAYFTLFSRLLARFVLILMVFAVGRTRFGFVHVFPKTTMAEARVVSWQEKAISS